MNSDLSREALYRIMERLKTIGAKYPGFATSQGLLDLLDCLTPDGAPTSFPGRENYFQLNRYLTFLKEEGLVSLESGSVGGNFYSIKLTSLGQKFVQPDLADFGRPAMLPQVVNFISNRIELTQWNAEEKAAAKFNLGKALADGATDVFVKLLTEVATNLLKP